MDKGKAALILLNGEKPSYDILKQHWSGSGLRVCADGAAKVCREYSLQPDIILGDLDSLDAKTKAYFAASEIIEIEDQNTTDGEKAVQYCIEKGFQAINLFGALGKRVDHTLYNLGMLKKFDDQGVELTLISNDDIAFLISGTRSFTAAPGTRISLLPVFGKVENVSSEGLVYALQNESLELGRHSSISNCFKSDTARVVIPTGQLLVVIERRAE
jgi:thiamine pyrophosphokinase